MLSRRASLLAALSLGLLAGMAYPLIDLALACRAPASEACVWGKAYLPLTFGLSLALLGGVVAALAYAFLTWRRHPPSNAHIARAPKSVAEIDTFLTMLTAACEDPMVHERLERLLSMPDQKRQALVHAWVRDLLIAEVPRDFVQAIACLLDDRVAEKAYEVIFKCRRGESP